MTSGPIVIGIDASTTACKAVAFDARGVVVAEGRAPIALHNPEPDGWEQDADEWWSALETALAAAARALGKRAKDVAALTVTNQRETFVVTDATGRPLHRARVWMDARGRGEVEGAVRALGGDHLHAVTGKPPCITPSFYKALDLFRRMPALRDGDVRFLDVHAFLVWRLSGELVSSTAAADPLGLVDLRAGAWATDLVSHLGLSASALPRLAKPGETIGALRGEVAARVGLRAGIPIVAGAGDGQAAGLGAGITSADRAYLNLGTALVSGVLTRDFRLDRAFRTMTGAIPGTFFLETDLKGGTFTIGWFVEQWMRRGEGDARSEIEILRALDEAAAALSPGAGGLMLVPYWNGVMNPYWDDDATGVVLGFRGDHGKAHFYRSILEGLAFEQRLHSRAVEAATGTRIDELVVMGGGAKSDLFCRIVADVLGRRVVRSRTPEATALGAAMLGAAAVGIHPDIESAAAAMTGTTDGFEPGAASAVYDRLFDEVYAGLYPALRSAMSRLRALC